MQHEPCRLLGDFNIACDLVAADTVFAVSDHPSCHHPFVERDGGIFHHSADLDGELALCMMLGASPSATLLAKFYSLTATGWAYDLAVRPTADSEIVDAIVRVREVDDRFLQTLRFGHGLVLHDQNYIEKQWSGQLYYCLV
jgi:hypothetical protein